MRRDCAENEMSAAPSTRKRWLGIGVLRRDGLKSGGHLVIGIAAALFSATLITSTLGFAFWVVAAHLTTTEVVGRSAAVISAMQFVATFATLGLHTLLVAELPSRDGPGVKRLVITSIGIAGGVSLAAAVGFAVIHQIVAESEWMYATPIGIALFGVGTAVTTATILLDHAVVGVQQSGRQVTRNLVFSIVKLVALPLAALAMDLSAAIIFSVWLFGNLVSMLTLALRTQAPYQWLKTTPSIRGFAPLWRTAAGHHWVNVATQTPRLVLPVMVAAQLSAEANAGFYAALLVVTFIWIIPNHLGTAMFALHSGNPQHFAAGLNTAIRLSAVVSIAAAVTVPIFARPLLAIFGPGYEDARYCLIALAICTFAGAVKSIYISVRRAQGALGRAARAAILGTVLELAAAEIGLTLGGVTGIGIALGAATVLEAIVLCPAIVKARREANQKASGGQRHHGAEEPEAADVRAPTDLGPRSNRA